MMKKGMWIMLEDIFLNMRSGTYLLVGQVLIGLLQRNNCMKTMWTPDFTSFGNIVLYVPIHQEQVCPQSTGMMDGSRYGFDSFSSNKACKHPL
jgi:hypothetical protein